MKTGRKQQSMVSQSRESLRLIRSRTHLRTWIETHTQIISAANTASETEIILSSRGWCLWRCESLDNDIIAIIRDEDICDLDCSYVTYTEKELGSLFNEEAPVDRATLRLIHEAKRCGILQSKHIQNSFGNIRNGKNIASRSCGNQLAAMLT